MKKATPTRKKKADTRSEVVRRLEKTWVVLAAMFEDLHQKGVEVDVASKLRDSKSLIHFVRTNISSTKMKDSISVQDSLNKAEQIIGEAEAELFSASLSFGEAYTEDWSTKLEKANRGELEGEIIYGETNFIPGVKTTPLKGWLRLALSAPVDVGYIQQVAKKFAVEIQFQDSRHITIMGEKRAVRKAAQALYS